MSVALTVPVPMPVCLEISDAVFGPSLSASRILALFCPRGVRTLAAQQRSKSESLGGSMHGAKHLTRARRALEFFCGGGDSLECRPKPRSSGGKILGHRNDEAEAVLNVPQLHLSYKPGPIHVRVREHHPRERFR